AGSGVVKYDQRRREPGREERRQRARRAEKHRRLNSAAAHGRFGRPLGAREQRDQLAVVNEHRGLYRDQHAAEEDDSQRKQRAKIAAKAAEQVGELRHAPALLRPGGGQKSDGEDWPKQRRNELSDRPPRTEFGQADQQIVDEEQQQPGQRSGAEHRRRVREPREAARRR